MPPERILLLRSGRHLRVALDALAAISPGCHVGVVGTPGSEAAMEQAGIAAADRFVYTGRARFTPLAFFFSATAVSAGFWRYDRVAILWNDRAGSGQGNVDRTALAISPRGYLAIAPDGTVIDRSPWPQFRREVARTAASTVTGAALGLLLYLPALALRPLSAFAGRAGR
jgi:hypothetical protein